ncbi:MAG: hypothetical protein R3B82_25940 [Sandaracinaceae bacterium]
MSTEGDDDPPPTEKTASERITIEELEALMAAAVDEDGNDIRLAEATARMTPEERRQSDENIRAWAAEVQSSLRKKHAKPPGV